MSKTEKVVARLFFIIVPAVAIALITGYFFHPGIGVIFGVVGIVAGIDMTAEDENDDK